MEYYLVPGEPGAWSLEPGQLDAASGQQDQGITHTVGLGGEALNGISKPAVAEVPGVKEQAEAVSIGQVVPENLLICILPSPTVRIDTKILNNMQTMMINNMQTYW